MYLSYKNSAKNIAASERESIICYFTGMNGPNFKNNQFMLPQCIDYLTNITKN